MGPAADTSAYKSFEKNGVRIRYHEVGSGYPLLAIPGGGLNSRINFWHVFDINVMEQLTGDFRCITMDQRNAVGGESTGPLEVEDPWRAFAEDHLALMDHLGIDKFLFFGNCIGASTGLKAMEIAPDRIAAAVLSQPIGHDPALPDVSYDYMMENWVPEFRKRRPDISMSTIETYLHNLYRRPADFVYSVSRDFVKSLETPILVLPDDMPSHSYQTCVELAQLAPNAEVTVFPWVEPPALRARTVERVRKFLKAHVPPDWKAA